MKNGFVVTLGSSLLIAFVPVYGENVLFPSDAGVVNVCEPPYEADSSGESDATDAIQQALIDHASSNAIIYMPNGTYLVSDTLTWLSPWKRTILQGQSQEATIIKLQDNATGYDDPDNPRPVIYTGGRPAQRFRNAIRNLTVDVGASNPGAIGIQFNASNQGCIRKVTISAESGSGHIGLDMSYTQEIGPLLVKNLTVDGFMTGIKTGFLMNSMTFEHITLKNQTTHGIYNDRNLLSIRKLHSTNSVPAVVNADTSGHVILIDSRCDAESETSDTAAIVNHGVLYARNCKITGYADAIHNFTGTETGISTDTITEFVSHARCSLFESNATDFKVHIRETPEPVWDDTSQWVSPTHYGADASGNSDASSAFEQAITSGKTTLYLPNGKYRIDSEVEISGNIRRIIGCEANLQGDGTLKITDGEYDTLWIERLDGSYHDTKILHASSRTLVMKDMIDVEYDAENAGDLYMEDVCSGPHIFINQNVWARQLNNETDTTKITNNGGSVWILGLKTEKNGTVLRNVNNATTEILGGELYPSSEVPPEPAFINENSQIRISISETLYKGHYLDIIKDIQGDSIRTMATTQLHRRAAVSESPDTAARHGAFMLPLYIGGVASSGAHPFTKGPHQNRALRVPFRHTTAGGGLRGITLQTVEAIYDPSGRVLHREELDSRNTSHTLPHGIWIIRPCSERK